MEDFYETAPDDAKRFGDLALKAVDEGFTAFKSMAVPETMSLEGLRPIKYAEACVKAICDAVGDDIDIMVDCHARPSPRMGMQFAKALEPLWPVFL
jgi:galactonate dehydratase